MDWGTENFNWESVLGPELGYNDDYGDGIEEEDELINKYTVMLAKYISNLFINS